MKYLIEFEYAYFPKGLSAVTLKAVKNQIFEIEMPDDISDLKNIIGDQRDRWFFKGGVEVEYIYLFVETIISITKL